MNKFTILLVSVACIGLCSGEALLDFNMRDVITSGKDIAEGAGNRHDHGSLSPKELLDIKKQELAGYPMESLMKTINKVCAAAMATESVNPPVTPKIEEMSFQIRTPCKNESFPLLKAELMLDSPDFDPKKNVAILVTGWTTQANETYPLELIDKAYNTIEAMTKAYACRQDTNFVVLDAAYFIDTLYTWSAFNTEEIGKHVARGLVELTKRMPVEKIHLIGHSLGAHIVGSAGRTFFEMTGQFLPRITGLDPAMPCFNRGERLTGLGRGDAKFVDIIHSNPGVLGRREPMGDADFYPSGLTPLPPGCVTIMCAHARSWWYFTESIFPGNEENFMAVRCSSMMDLKNNKCQSKPVPMGIAAPDNVKGNFFLDVHRLPPFGLNGSLKRLWHNLRCGHCDKKRGNFISKIFGRD